MQLAVLFGGSGLLSGAGLLKMGLMAGSALGMYLLGGKEKGEVSRLDDLKVSCSSYGKGIAIVYGTMRVTGNMIWATNFEEEVHYLGAKGKDKGSGKKGQKFGTPYYTYYANYAMLLCEGPVEEILRIWADSNLIYDKHNPKNKDLVSVGFSREGGGGKSGFGASKKKGGQGGDSGRFQFRFYPGTEEQLQDPFMVKKQSADLVPAYRGRCYLFFERFKLEDFGNRTPTITAEVAVKKKMGVSYDIFEDIDDQSFDFNNFHAEVDPERYKFYVQQFDRSGPVSDNIIRIYDMSTSKEIKRVKWSQINEINSDQFWGGNSVGTWLGLSGNGDFVFALGGGNSGPIAFIDPNTFISKATFGHGGLGLSNSATNIVHAQNCYPSAYIQPMIKMDGEIELTPMRCTIVRSYFGWFYIFGQNNEPLCYFSVGGIYGASILPISGGLMNGIFYTTGGGVVGNHQDLWQVTWSIPTTGDYGAGTVDLDHAISPRIVTVQSLSTSVGSAVGFSNISYLYGVGVVGWIWYRTGGPTSAVVETDERGIFAACVDPNDSNQTLLWNKKISGNTGAIPPNPLATVPVNPSDELKWIIHTSGQSTIWRMNFVTKEASFYTVGNQINLGMPSLQMYWPQRGAILTVIRDENNFNRWGMVLIDRNEQVDVDVDFIVRDLAKRVGIPDNKVDTQKLNEDEITGFLIEQPTSARNVVEDLAKIFMFDGIESDYKLKFVSRGQDPIVTIPTIDLVAMDKDTLDTYKETITQEIDLPQTVVVSYINAEKDYQTNTQFYRRPRSPFAVMQSRDKLEINEAMAMSNDFAKQTAHKVCMSLWTERINYDFQLPWKYMMYDPTDVLTLQLKSTLSVEARLLQADLGADFTIDCKSVGQSPASYTSAATAALDGGILVDPQPFPPQTRPYAADVPYLEDGDDVGNGQFAYYWGVCALGVGYKGAVVEYRLPATDWKAIGLSTEEIVWGSVVQVTPPPPWGPYATDDVNEITLAPGHDFSEGTAVYDWESIPDSQWPSTENCVIIGDEVIYFKNVEVDATGLVRISHLIRGARGTEDAAYRHKAGETFAINTAGLRQQLAPFATINTEYAFRSSIGFSLLPPYRITKTMHGSSHKPYSPNYFNRRNSGSNVIISWERQTRLAGEIKNGTGTVPLNEESEGYELYILEAEYDPDFFDPDNTATYVRKFTDSGSSRDVTYTAAMLTADGLTQDSTLYVVCFQLSSTVGRGFPGYATLYPSVLIEV